MSLLERFGAVHAVGFDLDGTLLDTLPDLAAAGNATLASLGLPAVAVAVVRSYIGDGVAVLVRRLLAGSREGDADPALWREGVQRFERFYEEGVDRLTRPYPGVAEVLCRLRGRGLRLAVVTNKPGRFTHRLLGAHGLDALVDLVVAGDTLPRRKPDPMPLVHACQVLGVAPATMLYVGDSANDVASARAAGCPVVCVSYGYGADLDVRELGADAIVDDILSLCPAAPS